MRVYLETLGCRLNYAEMAALGRQLLNAGHQLSPDAATADVCVLNSCAVTGEAARKSRQLVRQLARANPAARLVVTGCYASLEGEAVAALPNVTLVVGNTRKDELLALIDDRTDLPEDDPLVLSLTPSRAVPDAVQERTRAFVKVQDGCSNRCTFCIVTVARGEERSRPLAEVVSEINALHKAGYQEAVLTGVHLGAYGRDLGYDLRRLVLALLRETAIPRLRLSSLEPFDLAPEFFELWHEDERLMPHLHLPAQSGSDKILRRMARRNRVAGFEALAAAAHSHIPGLTLTTDLIAGFPGETEADFAETLDFVRRMRFAHIHAFPYSAREGTSAARFPGQIPEAERRRRSALLQDLDVSLGRAVRESFVGQVRPVLFENPIGDGGTSAGRGPDSSVRWSGLTDNFLRVHAEAPVSADLRNRIVPVRLTRVAGEATQADRLVLEGEWIEEAVE